MALSSETDSPWGPSRVIPVSEQKLEQISGPYERANHRALLSQLEDGEVILTFDDGPYTNPFTNPGGRHYKQPTTQMVLAQLDLENTQAVFFVQGSHAISLKSRAPIWKEKLLPAPKLTPSGDVYLQLRPQAQSSFLRYRKGKWDYTNDSPEEDGRPIYGELNPYSEHTLAAHTLRHERIDRVADDRLEEEILGSVDLIQDQWDEPSKLFRFPFGIDSPEANYILRSNDLIAVSWEIDSKDTVYNDRNQILDHILGELETKKKGVLLFHDTRRITATHIGWMIRKLKESGYRPATLK